MKPSAIIFDIDGTLADCSHRRHFVEGKKKDWESFYEHMDEDKPNANTLDYLCICKEYVGYTPLLVTGRPEKYRKTTRDWLHKHGGYNFYSLCLFMRPDDDYTPDDELKKRIYLEMIEPYYKVKLVIDDRDKVVKMWRSLGLECWQVAEGNF